MTKQFVKTLATVSFLIAIAIAATVSAQAQSLVSPIRVNVPFDFIVGEKTCPAGEYVVRRFQQYSSDSILEISSVDGHTQLLRLTNTATTGTPKAQVRLIFHRYGDQHFLYQVWPAGASQGREFARSRGEQTIVQKVRDSGHVALTKGPEVETVSITNGPR